MKDLNVINCTAYSNGFNSPLEYLNITTPAEFKVVMDLLCYYDSEKKTSTISRTGIARDTAMSVSNVERALKTLAQKDIIRPWNCQEMCSRRIPKILNRQESGGVMRDLF